MPTYDYLCKNCGHILEAFQSIAAEPLHECPACHELQLQRVLSGGSGLIFKGSGFYITDYKKSHTSTSSTTGDSSDKKTEKKD